MKLTCIHEDTCSQHASPLVVFAVRFLTFWDWKEWRSCPYLCPTRTIISPCSSRSTPHFPAFRGLVQTLCSPTLPFSKMYVICCIPWFHQYLNNTSCGGFCCWVDRRNIAEITISNNIPVLYWKQFCSWFYAAL